MRTQRFAFTRRLACLSGALMLSASLPAAAETLTLETARGPVAVEARPERVVVFDVAALDTLDALGVRPVGVPAKLYVSYVDGGDAAPVGTLFEPDFEAVAALEPDLIIIGSRTATQYEALEAIAPVIDMAIGSDTLLADGRARVAAYGALFGKEAEAAELEGAIDEEVAAARAAVAGKGDGLILMTNGPKVSAYGPGSRFGWVHAAVGLPPAVEDVDAATHGEAVSFEFVHEANPDWLLVIDRSLAIGEEGQSASDTLDNPLVAETTAWQRNQVVNLDAASMYIAGGGARSIATTLGQISDAFSK